MKLSDAPERSALDSLLAAYAAGTLDPATHALVASHLLLKPEDRRFVAALESTGGRAMSQGPQIPLCDRDGSLAAVFAANQEARASDKSSGVLPAPLRNLVGHDLAELRWRTRLPGLRQCRIADVGRGEASFIWLRAGGRGPSHTHEGSEITLVLSGGFSDVRGHYDRGDVAIAESDLDHRPVADPDQDCLCFAVTDAPLRLTGSLGRLLQRLFGHWAAR